MTTFYFMTSTGVEELDVPNSKVFAVEDYLSEIGAIALGGNTWSLEGFAG